MNAYDNVYSNPVEVIITNSGIATLNTYTVQQGTNDYYYDGLVVFTPPDNNLVNIAIYILGNAMFPRPGYLNYYTPFSHPISYSYPAVSVFKHGFELDQPLHEYAAGPHYLPNVSFVRLQQVIPQPSFFSLSLPPPITEYISFSLNARPAVFPYKTRGISYLNISSTNTSVLRVNEQNSLTLAFSPMDWHIPQEVKVTIIKAMGTAEIIITSDGMGTPSSVLFSNSFTGDACSLGWLGPDCNIGILYLSSLRSSLSFSLPTLSLLSSLLYPFSLPPLPPLPTLSPSPFIQY